MLECTPRSSAGRGCERGVGAVPGPTIGIDIGVGGPRQRPMRFSSLLARRRAVDPRAQEWVAKNDSSAELEQPIRLGGQLLHAPQEARFDSAPERYVDRKAEAACKLPR